MKKTLAIATGKKLRGCLGYRCIIHFFACLCIINFCFVQMPVTIYGAESALGVNALSAVLIDADTGIIIYEKNKDEILYPASITKIMTALLATEHYTVYDERSILFSHYAVFSLPYDSSSIAMDENETLSADEALYGLMLASANEVANALAEDISGSIEDFAVLMTQRARELGALNTSFANPHGLHDENHYTTAYDMALIMREAIKNPKFLQYISTVSHEIPPTERQPMPRPLNNSNKMIVTGSAYYSEDVVGGKTGYTDEARHTLVTYASRGGINLIAAILHGEKNEPYVDTLQLLDYGFDLYEETTLVNSSEYIKSIDVFNSQGTAIGTAELRIRGDIGGYLPKNIVPYLTTSPELAAELTEEATEGMTAGTLRVEHNGIILGEAELYIGKTDFVKPAQPENAEGDTVQEEDAEQIMDTATESDEPEGVPGRTMAIIAGVVLAVIIIAGLIIMFNKRRRYRRYSRYTRPLRFVGTGRFNKFRRF